MKYPLLFGLAALLATAADEPPEPEAKKAPAPNPEASFKGRDKDGDGAINREEFLAPAQGKDYFDDAKKNFVVYDFDRDGSLTLEEYSQTPGIRGDRGPGRVADPLAELASESAARFEGWLSEHDRNGDGRLDRAEFQEVAPDAIDAERWGAEFEHWDRGGTGSASLEDARLAAEIAYGVRNAEGVPMRDEGGQIVRDSSFRVRDRDGDGRIVFEELKGFFKDAETAEREFAEADGDGDGALLLGEFVQTSAGIFSATGAFKGADKDADGRLSGEEFVAKASPWERELATKSVAPFDEDGDGFLDFLEFRATPLANPIGAGLHEVKDRNRDGRVSLEEFRAEWEGGPPALAEFYFDRFDADGDGGLAAEEFPFREAPTPVPVSPEEEFANRDADQDGRLSREEFLRPVLGKTYATDIGRNFYVYDLDGDEFLQLEEFLQLPAYKATEGPGRVADPVVRLVDEAVAQFEGWLGEHDEDGDGRLGQAEFGRIPPGSSGPRGWGTVFRDWSRNRTTAVTVEDARLAAEIAYGVRGSGGNLLRDETGGVVNDRSFRGRDKNVDGLLNAAEFATHSQDKELAGRQFAEADADGDGALDSLEFGRKPSGTFNTVGLYKSADEDENGKLSLEEFVQRNPKWERDLASKSFPLFDENGDGSLSFSEYRLTPAANPIGTPLHRTREFEDDGKLDLTQFRAEWEGGPPALADLYFRRFDRDGDGILSVQEAPFEVRLKEIPPEAAFAARDADGDDRLSLRELHAATAAAASAENATDAPVDQRKLMESEEALRAADEDRDGLLSISEFQALSAAEAERKANPVSKARPPGPIASRSAPAPATANRTWFGLDGWIIAFLVFDALLIAAAAWWWLHRRKATASATSSTARTPE